MSEGASVFSIPCRLATFVVDARKRDEKVGREGLTR